MNPRSEFLLKFIKRYYSKSQVKRRTSKNQAGKTIYTINKTVKTFFDKKMEFSEKEIFKAFKKSGYTIMESDVDEFTWERFHQNHVLIMYNYFININTQCNSYLTLTRRSGFAPNIKEETLEKIALLKEDLKIFWIENKDLFFAFAELTR